MAGEEPSGPMAAQIGTKEYNVHLSSDDRRGAGKSASCLL